jgi:membrane protein implicated in regulation of membrane protease activity
MGPVFSNLIDSYGWWLLALGLIAAELIAPGYFLLWIGLAAAVMGIIMLVFPGMPFLAQAIVFAALALALCVVYWKFIRPAAELRNDQPLLNRKGDRMIGRRVSAASRLETPCGGDWRAGRDLEGRGCRLSCLIPRDEGSALSIQG